MYKILVPVDGSDTSLAGARQAARLAAQRSDAIVYLVNAQPTLNRHIAQFVTRHAIDGLRSERARAALQSARQLVEAAGVAVRSWVLRGEPAVAVARFANEERVDQIVLGASRKGPLVRVLTGSMTNRLLARVNAPVAVVAEAEPSPFERWGVPAGIGASIAAVFIAAE